MKRQGVTSLLAFLHTTHVQRLVVWRYNRISRSVPDLLRVIDVCEDLGVEVISVAEPVTGTKAMRRLQITMYGIVGQLERSIIAENQSIAYTQKQEEGKALSASMALGYRWDTEVGVPVINATTAPIVQFIFAQYLQGRGYRRLSELVQERFTRKMPPASIRVILQNRRYTGEVVNGYGRQPDVYPPLLTTADFERVQQLRQSKQRPRHPRPHRLKGKIVCPRCGHRLSTAAPNGHFYYECICCKPRFSVVMADIEASVWAQAGHITWAKAMGQPVRPQVLGLQRRRALKKYEAGDIDRETLQQRLAAISQQQNLAQASVTQSLSDDGVPSCEQEFFDRIDHVDLDESKAIVGLYIKRNPNKNEIGEKNGN